MTTFISTFKDKSPSEVAELADALITKLQKEKIELCVKLDEIEREITEVSRVKHEINLKILGMEYVDKYNGNK